MRYLPTGRLTPGMALGQDIYDGAGRLLLAKHLLLTAEHISNLEFLGFPGIYIDDEFTKGIEIQQIISPQVRSRALKIIYDLFNTETAERSTDLTNRNVAASIGSKATTYNGLEGMREKEREDFAQGIDVPLWKQDISGQLFRRTDRRRCSDILSYECFIIRKTEINQPDMITGVGNQDIGGLQITVDYLAVM